MESKDRITMSQKELKRLQVINKVLDKEVSQVKAAEVLGISDRQVRRIRNRVREHGYRGLIHRLRGRRSHKKFSDEEYKKVKRLYERKYGGFGPTLASEKLEELEGVKINRESLRKILIKEGLWRAKLKGRKHQRWRERKEHYGEMVQMDGSHHAWLEGRGPWMVLMGYIDDATGKAFGRFYEYEGTIPAMDSFKRYVRKNGLPSSVYLDKHSTYKSQSKQVLADVEGWEGLSEFERALDELGVKVIHANSAPAKGRVERLFKTLQDRLVKEMRLLKVKTMEEANQCLQKYLNVFNRKFEVVPAKRGNLHRQVSKHINLDEVLCIKTMRTVRNDFTVIHNKRLYQLKGWTYAKRAEVREYIDGRMRILTNGKKVHYRLIKKIPKKKGAGQNTKFKPSKVRILPRNQSWGTFKSTPSSRLTIS